MRPEPANPLGFIEIEEPRVIAKVRRMLTANNQTQWLLDLIASDPHFEIGLLLVDCCKVIDNSIEEDEVLGYGFCADIPIERSRLFFCEGPPLIASVRLLPPLGGFLTRLAIRTVMMKPQLRAPTTIMVRFFSQNQQGLTIQKSMSFKLSFP